MTSRNTVRLAGILLLAGLFAGCASKQPFDQIVDDAPPEPIDVSNIRNAVPKPEPLSRYGNMPSYTVLGKRYYTMPSSKGYKERGIASWYGTKFHGRPTSSMEPYDLYSMTAAHKSLPLPTYVEVKNLRNGHSVIVKVNDRGPFHDNRIIDLSYAAASKLDMLGAGTALVEVRAIDTSNMEAPSEWPTWPPPATALPAVQQVALASTDTATTTAASPEIASSDAAGTPAAESASLYLQVGAFRNQDNARRLQQEVTQQTGNDVRVIETATDNGTLYKVQVGPLQGIEEANRVSRTLKPLGISESRNIVQ